MKQGNILSGTDQIGWSRLLGATKRKSGVWLHATPVTHLETQLKLDSLTVAIALRLWVAWWNHTFASVRHVWIIWGKTICRAFSGHEGTPGMRLWTVLSGEPYRNRALRVFWSLSRLTGLMASDQLASRCTRLGRESHYVGIVHITIAIISF